MRPVPPFPGRTGPARTPRVEKKAAGKAARGLTEHQPGRHDRSSKNYHLAGASAIAVPQGEPTQTPQTLQR